MEILFKCDKYIYFRYDDTISTKPLYLYSLDCSNIKHLNDCQPICKVISNYKYEYDVYYILNKENIILKISDGYFIITSLFDNDTIDYTKLNINNLLNGNII